MKDKGQQILNALAFFESEDYQKLLILQKQYNNAKEIIKTYLKTENLQKYETNTYKFSLKEIVNKKVIDRKKLESFLIEHDKKISDFQKFLESYCRLTVSKK